MHKLLLTLEEGLPHWLGTPQIQWAQWAYGIWQLLRWNALTLFVLSMPVYLWQSYRKRKIVVLGETRDYVMSLEDMRNHRWKANVFIIRYLHDDKLCFLKYRKYFYYALTDNLRELTECERRFGENVVFVEKLLSITGVVSVGKMLSETDAFEKILSSQGCHISIGPPCVVPSLLDYVDVSSKFWGVLSTIPILLQAKNYNRVSTLLSFLLILLDLNRHWLYRIYDAGFNSFVKFVKLYIFKEQKNLFIIFSLFSSRWEYAYMTMPVLPIRIRPYCKLNSVRDLVINDFEVYREAPKIENLCMEINIDRAYVSLMQNNVLYTVAMLRRPVYVPASKLQWRPIADEREFSRAIDKVDGVHEKVRLYARNRRVRTTNINDTELSTAIADICIEKQKLLELQRLEELREKRELSDEDMWELQQLKELKRLVELRDKGGLSDKDMEKLRQLKTFWWEWNIRSMITDQLCQHS